MILPRPQVLFASRALGAATVIALGLSAFLGAAASASGREMALGGGAVVVLLTLAVLPVQALPSLALLLTVTLPADSLPLPSGITGMPVGLLPLAVYLVRQPPARTELSVQRAGTFAAGALVIWMLLSFAFAPEHTTKGFLWLAVFGICVPGTLATRRTISNVPGFESTVLNVVAALGAFAVVEAFVLHANPVYGRFYEQLPWVAQHWSTYRAETLMGHPLFNATVFAAALVLATHRVVRGGDHAYAGLARLALIAGGLAATYSRSGAVAAAVGVLMVLALHRSPAGTRSRRVIALLALVAAGALFASSFISRADSSEARTSAAARGIIIRETSEALRFTTALGAGPGQAEELRTRLQISDPNHPLESGWAQLAVALGPLGLALALVVLLIAALGALALRAGTGYACAMIAVLISIGGYNATEGHLSVWVLFGLLILAGRGAAVNARLARD